jgi:hypothetical protein
MHACKTGSGVLAFCMTLGCCGQVLEAACSQEQRKGTAGLASLFDTREEDASQRPCKRARVKKKDGGRSSAAASTDAAVSSTGFRFDFGGAPQCS